MFRYVRWRPQFLTDAVFAVILALVYVSMRSSLGAPASELALASFVLLGLGALIFYLMIGMNPSLAPVVHTSFFPLLSIFYLFLKWLPGVLANGLPAGTSYEAFGAGLLAYVIVLIGFFTVQLSLYFLKRERAMRSAGP